MIFDFCLEKTFNKSDTNIVLKKTDMPESPMECYGYNNNLNVCRNMIDNIDNENWKKVRWYINIYDFQVKDPIINRAFYKYWEIINEFDIFENYDQNDLILHCAEAPGGFIQGTNIYLQIDRMTINNNEPEVTDDGFTIVKKRNRNKKFENYRIYTISLNKDLPKYKTYNLPSYNKNILNKYLCVTYGKDNTGDINNIENIDYLKSLSNVPFYLVTADGGFDEGTDFNHKEQLHYQLILNEIYTALNMQKAGGHFVLKMFDVLTETSIHLLYLLFIFYREIYIYKPKTSRPTNSEKYVVCKFYNIDESDKIFLLEKLRRLSISISKMDYTFISFRLFDKIPNSFINRIRDINTILLDRQCEHLKNAIKLCNDSEFIKKYDEMLEKSLEERKEIFHLWEENYNLNSYV